MEEYEQDRFKFMVDQAIGKCTYADVKIAIA